MGKVLGHLKPAAIWNHFEKLCAIPRPSGKEEKVAAYIRDFATSIGLESIADGEGNVVVRKPATAGMENRAKVVLQAHMDMVPQKNKDVTHDFSTDPIRPRIDGEMVKATGTTLGADNGLGIAAVLAVLESKDLAHGPIEALFTVNEEVSLSGATNLSSDVLRSDILINLDQEDEGEVCIGCAGGVDVKVRMPYNDEPVPNGSAAFKISLTGLCGGHSGVDIHLGRANANKVMCRILYQAGLQADLRIASWEGGDLRNAIPRWAYATVTLPKDKSDAFTALVESSASLIRKEFQGVDDGLAAKVEKVGLPDRVMDSSGTERLLKTLYACPNGVFSMIRDMPGVTETSTNLGIVKTEKGFVQIVNLVRSSVETKRTDVSDMLRCLFELSGGKVELENPYPGWQPDVSSPVLKVVKDKYQERFGKPILIAATHGGLECGVILSKYPKMQAVSIGPTIKYPHSPDESLEIATVARFWDLLTDVLAGIPAR